MRNSAGLNSVDEFCLWRPPPVRLIGDAEEEMVVWCIKVGSDHGTGVPLCRPLTHTYKSPATVTSPRSTTPIGSLVYGNILGSDSSPIVDCCVMLLVCACIGVLYLHVSNSCSLVTEILTRLQIPSYS